MHHIISQSIKLFKKVTLTLFGICILHLGTLEAQVLEQDSLALVSFYDSMNGPNWTNSDNWLTSEVSDWQGITVKNNRVSSIYFAINNLSGTIPNSFLDLDSLESIHLINANFANGFPLILTELDSLRSLTLDYSGFTGNIPSEIGNLKALETLNLYRNNFSGTIPLEIFELTRLTSLTLAWNKLDGSIPSEISNLSGLKWVSLQFNLITGIPNSINSMTSLRRLSLNNNQINDLPDLTGLESVDIEVAKNNLTFGDIEPNISFLDDYSSQSKILSEQTYKLRPGDNISLETNTDGSSNFYQWYKDGNSLSGENSASLTLTNVAVSNAGVYYCEITNSIATELTLKTNNLTIELTADESDSLALVSLFQRWDGENWLYGNNENWLSGNLESWDGVTLDVAGKVIELEISKQNISRNFPNEVLGLNRLRNLVLSGNGLTGTIPESIGNLSELEELLLHDNDFEGEIPPSIGNLSKMKILYLFSNRFSGDLPSEMNNLSSLVNLWIQNNLFTGPIPDGLNAYRLKLSNNYFDQIPDYSANSYSSFEIQNNNFTFEDLEPNVGVTANFGAKIGPQRRLSNDSILLEPKRTEVYFTVEAGGSANSYQWYKDNVAIESEIDTVLNLGPITSEMAGIYHCEVSSSIVTSVELRSGDYNLTVRPDVDIQILSYNIAPGEVRDIDEIELTFSSYGESDLTETPFVIKVEGPDSTFSYTEQYINDISTEDTLRYTFTNTFDLRGGGTFEFSLISANELDEDLTNDTLKFSINSVSTYIGELPFFEDFENTNSGDQYIGKSLRIPGTEGLSFDSYNLIYRQSEGEANIELVTNDTTDSKYLSIEPERSFLTGPGDANNISELLLTIDLSDTELDQEVLLMDFAFTSDRVVAHDSSYVYIRGNSLDKWVRLYDWYGNRPDNNTWRVVERLAIKDTLENYGQTLSSSTQIKFLNAVDGDGTSKKLSIDDIYIYKQPKNDIQMLGAITPKYGMKSAEELTISFMNFGTDSQSDIQIDGVITGPDGIIQQFNKSYTESVSTYDTVSLLLTNNWDLSTQGLYEMKIYNSHEDENESNDTLQFLYHSTDRYLGELFLFENFDSITGSTYTEKLFAIPGLTGFSINSWEMEDPLDTISNTHDIYVTTDIAANETSAIQLGGNQLSKKLKHDLIFSIDLSAQSPTEDDIYMKFDYFLEADTKYTDVSESELNAVYIRGSKQDSWSLLYNYYDDATLNSWDTVERINLSQVLVEAGMSYSESTQIAISYFDQNDNEALLIDNFTLYKGFNGLSSAITYQLEGINYTTLGSNKDGLNPYVYQLNEETHEHIPTSKFPGLPRKEAVSFVLGDTVYLGLGIGEENKSLADFWSFDLDNGWLMLDDFPGGARYDAVSFVIDSVAYVGTGMSSNGSENDFWKFEPQTGWTQITSIPTDGRQAAFAFVVDDKAYVGGGFYFDSFQSQLSDIQEYDPVQDTWTEKIFADGINLSVNDATTFSLYGFGFIAYGNKANIIKYDPYTNEVENLGDFFELGDNRSDPITIHYNDRVLIGLGSYGFIPTYYDEGFYEFFLENEVPTSIMLEGSLNENDSLITFVGLLFTEDTDQSYGHTYELVTGGGSNDVNNSDFTIVGDSLFTNNTFNFEETPLLKFNITSTDRRGGSHNEALELELTDRNDTPTGLELSNNLVVEDNNNIVLVGELVAIDEDSSDSHEFSMSEGDGNNDLDNNQFTIAENRLYIENPDFELKSNYFICLSANDSENESFKQSFEVIVSDINESPTEITLSNLNISESNTDTVFVGTLVSIDEDSIDTHSYTIKDSDGINDVDNNQFEIRNDGLFIVKPNYEEKTEYLVNLESVDSEGLGITNSFVVAVEDVNEAPTSITIDLNEVKESDPVGTLVASFSTVDEDNNEEFTYQILNANDSFNIDENTMVTLLEFDISEDKSFSLQVQSEDKGGLSIVELFEVIITAEEELEDPLSSPTLEKVLKIYPNPFKKDLRVESNSTISQLSLYNLEGQMVFNRESILTNSYDIHLERKLEAGIYILNISLEDGRRFTSRIVKM